MAAKGKKERKATPYGRIILGTTILILVVAVIAKNASATHVDLLFVEGDVSVFELMLLAFSAGFLSCLSVVGLRKMRAKRKRRGGSARASAIDEEFAADEGWGVPSKS